MFRVQSYCLLSLEKLLLNKNLCQWLIQQATVLISAKFLVHAASRQSKYLLKFSLQAF